MDHSRMLAVLPIATKIVSYLDAYEPVVLFRAFPCAVTTLCLYSHGFPLDEQIATEIAAHLNISPISDLLMVNKTEFAWRRVELPRDWPSSSQCRLKDWVEATLSHLHLRVVFENLSTVRLEALPVPDAALVLLAVPSLTSLGLQHCTGFTTSALEYVVERCPKLRSFDASHCSDQMNSKVLCALAENCVELEDLTLTMCYGIDDEGMTAVARSCSRLRTLSIEGCLLITDNSVRAMCDSVCVAGFTVFKARECVQLTEASIAELVAAAGKRLSVLDVAGCPKIRRKAF